MSARHPHPQDRHRVHQAGRPAPRTGHRGMAGRPARPAEDARPQDWREPVDLLFATRARRVAKALHQRDDHPDASAARPGVPTADVRGNITSHRARATIATRLYNAKEPMTLFELQEWLGHRSPRDHPALRQDHPKQARAGELERRVLRPQRPHHRKSSSTATPSPAVRRRLANPGSTTTWAMALLRVPAFFERFPAPHGLRTTRLHPESLVQSAASWKPRDNLQRMLANIPLTDDERAAVDDGQANLDRLLSQLADVPTPAEPAPRKSAHRPRRPCRSNRRDRPEADLVKAAPQPSGCRTNSG